MNPSRNPMSKALIVASLCILAASCKTAPQKTESSAPTQASTATSNPPAAATPDVWSGAVHLLPEARAFKGSGDHLTFEKNWNYLRKVKAATTALWIRRNEPGVKDYHDLVAISVSDPKLPQTSRLSLRLMADGRVQAFGRTVDTNIDSQSRETAQPAVKNGKWVHVAAIVDYANSKITIYVNGKKRKLAPGKVHFDPGVTPDTPSLNATLGSEDDGSAAFFIGDLQDVGIWNRALSAEEIGKLASKR